MRCILYTCLFLLVVSIIGLITTTIIYSQSDVKNCALNCTVAMDDTNRCYLVHPDDGVITFPYHLNQTKETFGEEESCDDIGKIFTCYYATVITEETDEKHVIVTTDANDGKFYCFIGLVVGVIVSSIGITLFSIFIIIYFCYCGRLEPKYRYFEMI